MLYLAVHATRWSLFTVICEKEPQRGMLVEHRPLTNPLLSVCQGAHNDRPKSLHEENSCAGRSPYEQTMSGDCNVVSDTQLKVGAQRGSHTQRLAEALRLRVERDVPGSR